MKICPTCQLRYANDQKLCFVDRSELQEAADEWINKLIGGRYRIEDVLGEGGMATVYRARHTLQDKPVAIKLFRKELARDPKLRERFRREATATSRLAHPHIIEILDSGEAEDSTPYLVMEMLEGESLEALMTREKLPLPRAVDIVLQTLGALARAHDFQVIHRDLKPDNLFVCHAPDGSDFVKILDFGIARSMHDPRLTGIGEVFGTPQYMAPERITSIDAGPAADIYAMGVILYELCTGRLPFEAHDVTGYLLKHMREKPPAPRLINPQIPEALDALLVSLLEKDPSKRPVDAHAVVKELSQIAARMPRPRPGPSRPSMGPTPSEGLGRTMRAGAVGTLAPATLERWERRVVLFSQMISRLYPDGRAAGALGGQLERVRASLTKMAETRHVSLREQGKLEAIVTRAREAQARFGRAMDTLGQDLSRAREELRQAQALESQYSSQVYSTGGGPFASVHASVVAASASPTPELLALYRAGVEALEAALGAGKEHSRALAYLRAKEREVHDTEFQIQELRAQLERLSKASEDERAEVQKLVEKLGSEVTETEQSMIRDASALADALRGRREVRDLFVELEADAA